MARPLKEKAPLAKPLAFRLTEEDHAVWVRKVAQSGLSASEFFRRAVIQNQSTVSPALRPAVIKQPKPQSQHEAKLLFCISMISNNVNQIAHRLNADHKAGIVSRQLYESFLSELSILADKAKALGVK